MTGVLCGPWVLEDYVVLGEKWRLNVIKKLHRRLYSHSELAVEKKNIIKAGISSDFFFFWFTWLACLFFTCLSACFGLSVGLFVCLLARFLCLLSACLSTCLFGLFVCLSLFVCLLTALLSLS